jgi:tetratricopeptide (TPR) repeat protein
MANRPEEPAADGIRRSRPRAGRAAVTLACAAILAPVAAAAEPPAAPRPAPSAAVPASIPSAEPDDVRADLGGILGEGDALPPAQARLQLHVGQRYLQGGLFHRAVERFQDVTRSAPAHPGSWFLLSRALALSGRVTEALDAARRSVDLATALPPARRVGLDVAELHYNLGVILLAMARLEEAEAELRRALTLDPSDVRMRAKLGAVLLQEGEDAAAAEELRLVVEREPGRPGAWLLRGKALLRLDDLPGAEAALLRARELDPAQAEVRYTLASVFRARGDVEKQEAELAEFSRLQAEAEARRQADEAVDARLRDAAAHLDEGRFAEAAELLTSALELPAVKERGFRKARLLTDLARCEAEQGRLVQARDLYVEALVAKPDAFVASFELGTLLARHGQVDAAAPHLVAAAASNPFDPVAHRNLGLAFARMGRLNDALGELRRAATLDPESVPTRQALADLELAVGDEAGARALERLGGIELPPPRRIPQPAGAPRADGAPSPSAPAPAGEPRSVEPAGP